MAPIPTLCSDSPLPLIQNGKILDKNLKKARISVDDLLTELRKKTIADVNKVVLANREPDGTITSFLYPEHQPVTRADMQLQTRPFTFNVVVVKEGKIEYKELRRLSLMNKGYEQN
nr:DUF421 domain-containing protein [Lysinibacillus timonensis]